MTDPTDTDGTTTKRKIDLSFLAPVVRILLRYLGMWLVARGLMSGDAADVFTGESGLVDLIVGALTIAATEGYYVLARRKGWAT